MRVFTISGSAGHGKDTIASMLSENLTRRGYRVLITHYGDLVKYICEKFFGWDGQKDEQGRTLLQHVGTDIVRNKVSDFWVNFIVDVLTFFEHEWDFVLIPDTRFPNEIECLEDNGFFTTHVRVVRPGYDNGLTEQQNSHISERALDDVEPDYYIINDGSLEDLRVKVTKFVEENITYGRN